MFNDASGTNANIQNILGILWEDALDPYTIYCKSGRDDRYFDGLRVVGTRMQNSMKLQECLLVSL